MARIRKIMTSDVPTLKKTAKIDEAAKLLAQTKNSCVVIVENDMPIGIVSELDIVKDGLSKGLGFKEPVSKIMSYPVTVMEPNMKLDEALKIIDTKRFRSYPVVEKDQLIGVVTKNNIVHEISDNVKLHRNIQNFVLVLFVIFEFFVFVVYNTLRTYFTF